MKRFHDMPHVMHLFLSPGEGGEFVGWQGRHCAPSPHIHYAYTSLLALLFIIYTIFVYKYTKKKKKNNNGVQYVYM